MLPAYAEAVQPNALGLDFGVPASFADSALPRALPVQGNLDPIRLLAGGPDLEPAIDRVISGFGHRPHIFNLGHGILPETPIAHVERLVRRVKGG